MTRIVVIDDSKLMRTLLRHILEQAGYEVDVWEEVSASEVAERIKADNPDLIITDYQMPGCNGLTVARMARKVKPELPVIVVTSSHDSSVSDALARVDVTSIVYKPLQEQELFEAIKRQLTVD